MMHDDTFRQLLANREATVALVGASENPAKYGSIIYRDLKAKGYNVIGVTPHRATVHGDPTVASLSDLVTAPDIINVVVPAPIGIDIARQANELGYKRIWYQPGSESTEIVDYLEEEDFEYLAGPCIMVWSR